jgi:hypothetical protein
MGIEASRSIRELFEEVRLEKKASHIRTIAIEVRNSGFLEIS